MVFTISVISEFGRLRQVDREFEATVDYRARLLQKEKEGAERE